MPAGFSLHHGNSTPRAKESCYCTFDLGLVKAFVGNLTLEKKKLMMICVMKILALGFACIFSNQQVGEAIKNYFFYYEDVKCTES